MFNAQQTIFTCECLDTSHHVALTTWHEEGYLTVCSHRSLSSVRDRIRAAWRCLFGPSYADAEVLLTPKVARDMARALNEWADKVPTQTMTVTTGGDTNVTWVKAPPPGNGPVCIYNGHA